MLAGSCGAFRRLSYASRVPLESALEDGEAWTFDQPVADSFDEMLERSIPGYSDMRALVFSVGTRYVRPATAIVDLGCARGEALAPFVEILNPARENTFLGFEISEPMRVAAQKRFLGNLDVIISSVDLRHEFPRYKASLTLAVLTLQFTPINYRQRILRQVYERTTPGGALILVEKVLGADADLDAMLCDEYHSLKTRNGYSEIEIERKRLALEGVLVPVTAAWNEDLLRGAGFTGIDCFWRHLNFAAWVAVR